MLLDRQRIDKWLWHARVVRTRTAAAALAAAGHVRLNGTRIDAASRAVKAGDVVTVALDSRVRVLEVAGFAERRGSATDAAALFVEHGGPAGTAAGGSASALPEEAAHGVRERGAGRPTKQERRAILRLTGRGDDEQ
ncbi:Ribosome-associated heat shock protein [Rhodovulum sp. PH10]|uniref:RNA-binding S4 domain-containing protein n=1 Tax=Rhodovulum sp. PH10 TaxID=1187851 RepID=UPI00027C23B3|nr:S4 domain-containing protein [Rhodovulum sp. PH10]EJW10910.1 Ribosome-associated heat shock protein [Rhodovulum sp. PH10]